MQSNGKYRFKGQRNLRKEKLTFIRTFLGYGLAMELKESRNILNRSLNWLSGLEVWGCKSMSAQTANTRELLGYLIFSPMQSSVVAPTKDTSQIPTNSIPLKIGVNCFAAYLTRMAKQIVLGVLDTHLQVNAFVKM